MPHPVAQVGTPIVPIDVATPQAFAGPGTVFLNRFTPGYILGGRGKKQQQVGSLAEDPLLQAPIEVPIPLGTTVSVAVVEMTDVAPFTAPGVLSSGDQDPKVGRRRYALEVHAGGLPATGALLHQEEFFFDDTLSTTTFTGSFASGVFTPYSAFAPGDQFQKGSVRQPALIVQGFFVLGV